MSAFGAVYRDVSSLRWFGFCVRLSWPGACGLGGCLAKSANEFSTMCCAAGPRVYTGACDRSVVGSVLISFSFRLYLKDSPKVNGYLLGEFSALVPVVVRLAHSPPPLGAASAARVYRVLAAVVSSLRERIR